MTGASGLIMCAVAPLAALVSAQAAYAQSAGGGYEPPVYHDGETLYEKSERSFGRFTVVRYIEDCRAVPMLDFGCWLTKEARLDWHDSSGTIGFSFIDNGSSVRFKARGESADHQTICIMQAVLVGYDPKPSAPENWQRLRPFIGQQLRDCTAIAPANLSRVLAEAGASAGDYAPAANAWKSVSVELFGANGARCTAERVVKSDTRPPQLECTKYLKR